MMDLKDLQSKATWELKHNRGTVIAIAVVTIIVLAEVGVYAPFAAALKTAATDLATRTREVETAKTTGLTQISPAELVKLQRRTQTIKEGFVKVAEISTVLDRISDQAEKNSVRVVNVNSEEPVAVKNDGQDESQKITRLPIRMNLEGSFRSIAEFIRSVAQTSQQVFVVESYTISKSKDLGGLSCEMVLSFFSNG